MKFGLDIWQKTPLCVKVSFLELQKQVQELQGENQQLREQRDRLRGVSRQCVRYGLSRSKTNIAFVSQEERRLVARCARLKRALRGHRDLCRNLSRRLKESERDFRDCNTDRQEAIAVLEKISRERASLQSALLKKTHEWGELLGRLSAEEDMHTKTRSQRDTAHLAEKHWMETARQNLVERDEALAKLEKLLQITLRAMEEAEETPDCYILTRADGDAINACLDDLETEEEGR